MNSQYSAANIFTDTYVESFPRHLFNKSYTNSFTCNHGFLYPAFVKPVIPGDKFNINSYGRVQLTPLATNSMQNIKCYMRYFYVPNRVVWDKWDKFISQDGFVESPILAPFATLTGAQLNAMMSQGESLKLLDFLGVQFDNRTDNTSDGLLLYSSNARVSFNLFKFFSYWLIWDTFFRDENIQDPIFDPDSVQPGFNPYYYEQLNELLPVAKEKDYFTTALPWTQKGEPVNLNAYLSGLSPIQFTQVDSNNIIYDVDLKAATNPYYLVNTQVLGSDDNVIGRVGKNNVLWNSHGLPRGSYQVNVQPAADVTEITPTPGTLTAYLNANDMATSFTINELRYANALQRYLERLALGGNRPAEFYLSMYGVKIDDLRIGNPLYLGGGSTYVHVTSIAQTMEGADSPLATLAGNGQAQCSFSINEPYYASEFGYVFGMFYIRPELNYTQGLARDMQLFNHLDFYNPIFAHLGEEPVRKSELMLKPDLNINPAAPEYDNDETFGYQSRYAYLKQSMNEVHGELKTTLSKWLLSSRFESVPTLNSTFITQPQNYDIFAVLDDVYDHYIVEMRNDFEVESSMPDFAIPSL